MKTTTILSLAILATLPFAANATDPIGPAAVPSNGTAVVATANPPYQTVTVGANDNSHIASTAYVKGAYNDAIAAVNKVDSEKQDKLVSPDNNEPVYVGEADATVARTDDYVRAPANSALQGAYEQLATVAGVVQAVKAGTDYVQLTTQELLEDKQDKLEAPGSDEPVYVGYADETVGRTDDYVRGAGDSALQGAYEQLATVAGVVQAVKAGTDYMKEEIDAKRVDVYTTWDSNDTTQVALSNLQQQ